MVHAQKQMTAHQILQSLKAAVMCFIWMRSIFVTRPWPEPVSRAMRLMTNSFSWILRKPAVSGLSGKIFQMTSDMRTGTMPSRMKIQFQPFRPAILEECVSKWTIRYRVPWASLPSHVLDRIC